ncbi:MAG: hypothetical protein J5802_01870 [Butyrivibrio sp.]|nr:hypothetical protein [Butyrivibrio sp.]
MKKRLRGKKEYEKKIDYVGDLKLNKKLSKFAIVFSIVVASMAVSGCEQADIDSYVDLLGIDEDESSTTGLSLIYDDEVSSDETPTDGSNDYSDTCRNGTGEYIPGMYPGEGTDPFNTDSNEGTDFTDGTDLSDGSGNNNNTDNSDNSGNDDNAKKSNCGMNTGLTDNTGIKDNTDPVDNTDPADVTDAPDDKEKPENTETDKTDDSKKNKDSVKEDDSANKASTEDKATEAKTDEPKPEDTKPEETKPEDTKPANTPSAPADESELADYKFAASYKKFYEGELDANVKKVRENAGLTKENIEKLKKEQANNYAYNRLTEAGKNLYVELLTIVNNESEKVFVSTTDPKAIELVFDYVMMDHPEIFWVNGYHYINYSVGGVIDKIAFTGDYTYDKEEVQRRQAKIDAVVNDCLSKAPSTDDEYYAIKYVYEYLVANTEYVSDAPDNQNICSVFIGKKSVCNGYSKATQYLLNKMGIQCMLITGTVNTTNAYNGRHAWNLVRCNGEYYYMDTTWGDASYSSSANSESAKAPRVNYDYLCTTEEAMGVNHKLSDAIKLPECNSMKDNYYVREGLYFETADLDRVKQLFDKSYEEGSNNVTVKCATKEVYDSLFEQLIRGKAIFSYLQGEKKAVSYTNFDDTKTIIFWIK